MLQNITAQTQSTGPGKQSKQHMNNGRTSLVTLGGSDKPQNYRSEI